MNGHLRRLPNNCGFIEKYTGTILSFKTILYLMSCIYSNEHINQMCKFRYKDFNFISNVFSHQGRKFICKTIVDSVYMNESWLSEYANIKFDEQRVYVDYTDKMIQICQTNATNYYLFDMDTIIRFNNIGSIKLYLIYRRNLFMTSYKSEQSFCCNNETICRIFPNYTSYRILRHAINNAINDFCKVTGINVDIKKRGDNWSIIYTDNKKLHIQDDFDIGDIDLNDDEDDDI